MDVHRFRVWLWTGLLLFLISGGCVQGQTRQVKKADTAFRYHMYDIAVTQYQKAFARLGRKKSSDPDLKNRILFQIAESYRLSGQLKLAARQYQRCIRAGYHKTEPKVYFNLANLQLGEGDFEMAIQNYQTFLEYIPDSDPGAQGYAAALEAARNAARATRYQVENVRKLNTGDGDWAPRYYGSDGNILAFTSTRQGVTGKKTDAWTGQRFSDIFVSKLDAKGTWSEPERLDKNGKTSTNSNESDASFCKEGTVMYYTYCGNARKTKNRCVIKTATFDGEAWSEPEVVDFAGDSVSDFIHPFVTESGTRIYFASNKEGGYGDLDIWYADGDGAQFGEPVNMNWINGERPNSPCGTCINTEYKEAYPFYRSDSLFYFSSTGHGSSGGFDLFRAVKRGRRYEGVENMGYPLSTNADDFGICFLPGQNRGVFSSNRGGGRGGDDIYSFYLPELLFTISGTVTNTETLQPVKGADITLAGSDGELMTALTDNRGYYEFGSAYVNENTTYKILVEKKNYLGAEATETTVGLVASEDFVHDFALEPIPRGPVVLPEILYDFGKWDLREQYQDSLMELIVLLEKNPRLVIELMSHTDSRPIAMTNEVLSQNRAQSVVDYLIKRGIDGGRLVAKGYGAQQPRRLTSAMQVRYNDKVYDFDSGVVLTDEFIKSLEEKDYQEAAHQLNRRTEFSVLREDFIPDGNRSLSVLVGFADMADANKIPYTLNPDKKPEIKVVVSGLSMKAVVDAKAKYNMIRTDAVMRLLQAEKLGKNNFKNKEKSFDKEGEVLPNQQVQLRELKAGNFTVNKADMVTVEELPAEIVLSPAGMSKFGKYTIDADNMKIVIE